MAIPATSALRCKFPGCHETREAHTELCEYCTDQGLEGEYALYRTYLAEGMSAKQAKENAGIEGGGAKRWYTYFSIYGD